MCTNIAKRICVQILQKEVSFRSIALHFNGLVSLLKNKASYVWSRNLQVCSDGWTISFYGNKNLEGPN